MMTRPRYATGARTLLLSTGLALCTAMAAQASTFSWEFSGTIAQPTDANPVGDNAFASGVFSGQGTSALTWGNAATTGAGNPLNVLSIGASAGNIGLTSGATTQVQFGSFSWLNTSVFGSGGIWDTVLALDLSFGSVTGSADVTVRVDNTFDPDNSPAANNASGLAPDTLSILGLTGFDFSQPLDLGDGVILTGFSAQIVSDGQCGTANPGTTGSWLVGNVWTNCEGNTSVIGLFANVRYDAPDEPEEPVAPIPLPAAGWLLLGGLAGLGALRARRRTAA